MRTCVPAGDQLRCDWCLKYVSFLLLTEFFYIINIPFLNIFHFEGFWSFIILTLPSPFDFI